MCAIISTSYIKGKIVRTRQRIQRGVRIVTAVIAVVMLCITGMSQVTAVDQTNSANTLKISPVRSDISIKAGDTHTLKVAVTNLTKSPITVRPVTNDFIAGDERGTPALVLDADQFAPTHSLKRFMKPLADITIPAGELKQVDVGITVPKDAQAGGYFGAIRFAPATPDSGGEVNLSASVASLILMTVPGPVTEKLNLTNFDIQQKGTTGTYFRDGENLSVLARFENKGSIQEGPFGVVSVKKGDTVVYTTKFNDNNPRDMVLPDSARRWDISLQNIEGFGHYTVYGTFTYGAKNQTIEITKSFWVIPWVVIIGAGIGLLLLIVFIIVLVVVIRNKRRRRNLRSFTNSRNGGSFRIK